MLLEHIKAARAVAEEFIRRADACIEHATEEHNERAHDLDLDPASYPITVYASRSSGALRRQSMELTRALTAMRKP